MINGVATTYQYDGLDIVRESGGGGDASYLRTLALDETLARTDAAGTTVYLADLLGSSVALADVTGSPSTTYTYAPFGETAVAGAPAANPVQFTGRENDGTGLYYYRARYYDPTRSRFVSEDPIGVSGGVNFYSYVANNPINAIDPEGKIPPIGWAVFVSGTGLAVWAINWWYQATHPPSLGECTIGNREEPRDQVPGSPGVPRNFPPYQPLPPLRTPATGR